MRRERMTRAKNEFLTKHKKDVIFFNSQKQETINMGNIAQIIIFAFEI